MAPETIVRSGAWFPLGSGLEGTVCHRTTETVLGFLFYYYGFASCRGAIVDLLLRAL